MSIEQVGAVETLRQDRKVAAQDVAQELFALEAQLDEALASAGRLNARLSEARLKARVSAVVGQDAFALVGETVSALHTARAKAVAAHNELADVHEKIFRQTYASGDLWKFARADSPRLSIVAAKAA